MTEQALGDIARLPNLKSLDLGGANVPDDWLPMLSAMRLESISLSDTMVSAGGLIHLVSIHTLRELKAERIRMPREELSVFASMKSLNSLFLDRVGSACELIPHLKRLPSLTSLTITNSGLVDADVVDLLNALPQLNFLNVEGNSITGSTIIIR